MEKLLRFSSSVLASILFQWIHGVDLCYCSFAFTNMTQKELFDDILNSFGNCFRQDTNEIIHVSLAKWLVSRRIVPIRVYGTLTSLFCDRKLADLMKVSDLNLIVEGEIDVALLRESLQFSTFHDTSMTIECYYNSDWLMEFLINCDIWKCMKFKVVTKDSRLKFCFESDKYSLLLSNIIFPRPEELLKKFSGLKSFESSQHEFYGPILHTFSDTLEHIRLDIDGNIHDLAWLSNFVHLRSCELPKMKLDKYFSSKVFPISLMKFKAVSIEWDIGAFSLTIGEVESSAIVALIPRIPFIVRTLQMNELHTDLSVITLLQLKILPNITNLYIETFDMEFVVTVCEHAPLLTALKIATAEQLSRFLVAFCSSTACRALTITDFHYDSCTSEPIDPSAGIFFVESFLPNLTRLTLSYCLTLDTTQSVALLHTLCARTHLQHLEITGFVENKRVMLMTPMFIPCFVSLQKCLWDKLTVDMDPAQLLADSEHVFATEDYRTIADHLVHHPALQSVIIGRLCGELLLLLAEMKLCCREVVANTTLPPCRAFSALSLAIQRWYCLTRVECLCIIWDATTQTLTLRHSNTLPLQDITACQAIRQFLTLHGKQLMKITIIQKVHDMSSFVAHVLPSELTFRTLEILFSQCVITHAETLLASLFPFQHSYLQHLRFRFEHSSWSARDIVNVIKKFIVSHSQLRTVEMNEAKVNKEAKRCVVEDFEDCRRERLKFRFQ